MTHITAVVGMAYCGTTMVAGCLEILGVPMVGPRFSAHCWEDIDVQKALQNRETFAALIERRSGRRWGFKCPGAWRYPWLAECLGEDVTCLAIYKDPVTVARRRFKTVDAGALLDTLRRMRDSVGGIAASGLDVHWLSYLDAVTDPRAFVLRLAELAGVSDASPDRITGAVQFIEPGDYREVLRGG